MSTPWKQSASGAQPAVDQESDQAARVKRYLARLEQLQANYGACYSYQQSALGFNDSLAAARRSLNSNTRKRPLRRRVDPQLEAYIGVKALEAAQCIDPHAATPKQVDVNAAAAQALETFKPRRGRPADALLAHHVHAFMALHLQTCGQQLRALRTQDSVYDPHLVNVAGKTLLQLLRHANPLITETQIVEIVLAAHASGEIVGKRFEHYFPIYARTFEDGTSVLISHPGFKIERFVAPTPIYSS